jgi:YfiH family protein
LGDGRVARVRFTTRADGDLAIAGDPDELAARRAALVDLPWTWLRQVHEARVVHVDQPGDGAGEPADAAVTAASGAVLAVHTADCGPIALVADGGAVAVAHAGWKGLAEGVVGATVEQLRSVADGPVRAVVGPFIHPECYEFGAADLQRVVDRLGPEVEGRTAAGTPALDLGAGIRTALAQAGVTEVTVVGGCTACGPDAYSHRARGDVGRQAVLAWIEEAA